MTQPAGHAAGSCGSPGAFRTCGACCGVVASPNSALCSVQNSPCSGSWWPKRYKTLPACVDCAKSGHFGRAGRVLSRTCGEGGCAWRVLYRKWGRATCAGRVLYRRGPAWLLLGELCRALASSLCQLAGYGSALALLMGTAPGSPCPGRSPCRWWWGFCSIRSWLTVYLRRVAALMMQFPRLGVARPRVEGVWPPKCRPIG